MADPRREDAPVLAFEQGAHEAIFRIVRSDGSIAIPLACNTIDEASEKARREVSRALDDKAKDPRFNGTIEVLIGPSLARNKKALEALEAELRETHGERELASGASLHVHVRHVEKRHWKMEEWEAARRELASPTKRATWIERGRSYGLLLVSAVLMFLGFAGFGVWPLAFVGMIPALFVFDGAGSLDGQRPTGGKFFWRALFFGYIAYWGGFYWIVDTIVDFGGFPYLLALLFGSVYFVYQACEFIFILWIWRRARDRGFNATLALVSAYVAVELVFPMLFDHYYGNSFHMLPPLVQLVDLGGPMMLTALAMLGNGALYETLRAKLRKEPFPKASPIVFAAVVAFALGYGYWRIADVEARVAAAPKIEVGLVQPSMSIYEAMARPMEGRRREIEQSLALEAERDPDLIVWPESAVSFFIPEGVNIQRGVLSDHEGHAVTAPVLFGGLSRREVDGVVHHYNTAFLTDAAGNVTSTYDKTYLLAFGEYIPFGELFPQLYDYSPNTGHFTPGNHVRPMRLGDYRITTLVCYEDILPRFVRRAVAEGDPHLLVNITNDAWFGATHEPYVHLALAKFRAAEHHRYLVRTTNTGVSAIVDPAGRIVTESPLFERATLHGEVAMMTGWTPYETLGDWPGWAGLVIVIFMTFVGRWPPRRSRAASP